MVFLFGDIVDTLNDVLLLALSKYPSTIKNTENTQSKVMEGLGIYRVRIHFHNNYGLSVVHSGIRHPHDFELAVIDHDGAIHYELNLVEDSPTDVVTNCDMGKVMKYVELVGNYKNN